MEAEFDHIQNVRFPSSETSRMYDSKGNVMHCKCGNPAAGGVFGKNSFKCWCAECNPNKGSCVEFIYKEPDRDDLKFKIALEICEGKKD
jgi:hypothetical protein